MVRNLRYPPAAAWNFVSFGLMVFLCGSGYSVSRAKVYQLELAEYKLQVGSALNDVKKVSDTLEKVSNSSTIAPVEKQKIRQLTKKSDRILDRVSADIEESTNKLINSDIEE